MTGIVINLKSVYLFTKSYILYIIYINALRNMLGIILVSTKGAIGHLLFENLAGLRSLAHHRHSREQKMAQISPSHMLGFRHWLFPEKVNCWAFQLWLTELIAGLLFDYVGLLQVWLQPEDV